MGHDPVRAGLVGALALLLVATGLLFPAGGVGSYPAAAPAGGGPGTGPAGENPATGPADDPPTDTGSEATDEVPGTDTTPTDAANGSTPTPTETPTATPALADTDRPAQPTLGLGALIAVGVATIAIVIGGRAAIGVQQRRLDADLPDGRLPRVRAFVAAIPRATVAVLVGAGSATAGLGRVAASAGRLVTAGGVGTITGTIRTLTASATSLGGLLSLPSVPSTPDLSVRRSGTETDSSRRGRRRDRGGEASDQPTRPTYEPPDTVREAWAELPAYVPGGLRNVDRLTPGEVARRARRRGLPAEPVETLTAAFRRVRYGEGVSDEHRSAALAALARLREAVRDEGGEES